MQNHRARWAAIGAAVAVSIGAGGLITFASASGGTASSFTPITPCRLLDTRGGFATGATPPRATALGQGESITIPARGDFGKCVGLSSTDTGAMLNVTIVNPSSGSFLTVWPADKDRPLASSLNWVAGQGATPNQVTTALDASGQFNIFNNGGTVDVIIDVVGLFEPSGAGGGGGGGGGGVGPQGPQGPQGSQGPAGSPGGTGPQGPAGLMTAATPAPKPSGQFPSMVLDAAGNPVVSHLAANGDLLLTHCNDPACGGGGDVTNFVVNAVTADSNTSLALDANGFPVISYYDSFSKDPMLVHCNDANCAGGGEAVNDVTNTTHDDGEFSSLALDASGNPVISFYDTVDTTLKLVHCSNANCSGVQAIQTPDPSSNDIGSYTSLALDGNGLPIISYYDATSHSIALAHCDLADCGSNLVQINPAVVSTPGITDQDSDLVLDGNGFPAISFLNTAGVSVALCADSDCTSANVVPLDISSGAKSFTSIALDAAGLPAVSYFSGATPQLKLAKCTAADCSTSVATLVDSLSTNGQFTSMALDRNGNPIIGSYDSDVLDDDLVITHCVDPFCNPKLIRVITG